MFLPMSRALLRKELPNLHHIQERKNSMELNLKDKVVLITGATGGIGEALCRRFAAEGCRLDSRASRL